MPWAWRGRSPLARCLIAKGMRSGARRGRPPLSWTVSSPWGQGLPEKDDSASGPPRGCVPCLQGRGSNVSLTTLCNRDCFFCFNPKPRTDDLSVHGRGPGRSKKPAASSRPRALPAWASAEGTPALPGQDPRPPPADTAASPEGLDRPLTNGDLLTRDLLEQAQGRGHRLSQGQPRGQRL